MNCDLRYRKPCGKMVRLRRTPESLSRARDYIAAERERLRQDLLVSTPTTSRSRRTSQPYRCGGSHHRSGVQCELKAAAVISERLSSAR